MKPDALAADERLRRCVVVYVEPRMLCRLDALALLRGEPPLQEYAALRALAPHLDEAVEVTVEQVTALSRLDPERWRSREELELEFGAECIAALLGIGLLLSADRECSSARRDADLRAAHWHPLSALVHCFTRWQGVQSEALQPGARFRTWQEIVTEYGPPPGHFHQRHDALHRTVLPGNAPTEFDMLAMRRATCRNFDVTRTMDLTDLATVMHSVFGSQAVQSLAPQTWALKKHSPSGGGFHAIEAYVLTQRVSGLATGLHHYNVEAHALDQLAAWSEDHARVQALRFVAGQDYFADVHALVVLTARFARPQWKYRNHPKMYRALLLEAGHLSQNLYLAATQQGLAAFVTAAINEVDIEQQLGLDPLQEGVLAICGFGLRAGVRETVEFDPLCAVWSAEATPEDSGY